MPASLLSRQVAAMPVFFDAQGHCHILMVTTRTSGRWIVPKGWHIPGLTGFESAAREAFEEAGVSGIVSQRPIAAYDYVKSRKDRHDLNCRVDVYLLQVRHQAEHWPEEHHRQRRWMNLADAGAAAGHSGLGKLIANNHDLIAEVVHA